MSNILDINKLSFCYKRGVESYTVSVDSLKLDTKNVIALTGVSGCGKSTILECIGLLRENMSFDKFNMLSFDIGKICKKDYLTYTGALIGFMPQSGGLLPYLSILDNVKYKISIARKCALKLSIKTNDSKELLDRAISLFDSFNLTQYLKRFPHELSIGQRQRAVFVKTLATGCPLVLIDEPTSALDPKHSDKLFDEIVTSAKALDIGAIIVTHDTNKVRDHNLRCYDFVQKSDDSGCFVEV